MQNRYFLFALFAVAFCLSACINDDVRKGNDALFIGDYERAIKNFSKALDKEPTHRDARYGLALSYYSMAEEGERLHVPTFDLWKRTADEFRILSKIDSSAQIDANHSTCLFYLARAAMASGENEDVLSLLNQSIDLDSSNYFSLNLKALILGNSDNKKNVEQAKQIFIHIVTHDPDFVSAYVNLGNIYWEEKDFESAWDTWSMGLEKAPENSALIRWTKVAEDSLKTKALSEGI